jgi:hypothetical protein
MLIWGAIFADDPETEILNEEAEHANILRDVL